MNFGKLEKSKKAAGVTLCDVIISKGTHFACKYVEFHYHSPEKVSRTRIVMISLSGKHFRAKRSQ